MTLFHNQLFFLLYLALLRSPTDGVARIFATIFSYHLMPRREMRIRDDFASLDERDEKMYHP